MKRDYKVLLEIEGIDGLIVSEVLQCLLDRISNKGSIPMKPNRITVTNIPSYSSVTTIHQEEEVEE